MAAYLETKISRTSKATPDAGIDVEVAEDKTLKFRGDGNVVNYALLILHEWITGDEFAAILTFLSTYGYGPHTITLHGIGYSFTLINEPEQLDRKGDLYMVQTKGLGTKT